MKYVIDGTDNPNSSHSKILSHIPQGAKVLECGCATGYMTKYMSQKLGCRVSIIEYEQAAFEIAKQYAADGLCCDLMGQEWCGHFAGQRFDAIVFGDVLEHLSNPDKVLARAAEFLEDNGLIVVSIPNVAHNDIILKLLRNRWDYTPTGLLDDTHIHFWAAENLDELAHRAGLRIVCREGVYCATMRTEQSPEKLPSDWEFRVLKDHRYGEVYQFVLTMQKEAYAAEHNITPEDRLLADHGSKGATKRVWPIIVARKLWRKMKNRS